MNINKLVWGVGGAFVLIIGILLGFIQHPATSTAPGSVTASTSAADAQQQAPEHSASAGVSTHSSELDLTALPLGDGKVSTVAKTGYVYSCQQSFDGGGAEHAGNWIHGSTWNLNEKIAVEGSVSWPNATFSNIVSGVMRVITGNGLPVDTKTGTFPIQHSDPAFQYDRNPNAIKEQTKEYSLPANPVFAQSPVCLPMGAIGIALNGVAIYNALDASGRDAVAHETQDSCDGHPQGAGEYHYHGPSPCMPNVDKKNTVVGYALDGFPITSLYDANNHLYTNADLDVCHGMTGSYIDENGNTTTGYHYVLTWEYPYTLGCYRGTPVRSVLNGGNRQGPPPQHP